MVYLHSRTIDTHLCTSNSVQEFTGEVRENFNAVNRGVSKNDVLNIDT